MRAAWYEKQGPAKDVLTLGEMPDPHPAAGEVRIRIAASGINPGDIKKRQDAFGYGMAYARVIPHSDGAGQVDETGGGVPPEWLGQSVWCYGAQSYRPSWQLAKHWIVTGSTSGANKPAAQDKSSKALATRPDPKRRRSE
jgi:NADPH:quinone reductase